MKRKNPYKRDAAIPMRPTTTRRVVTKQHPVSNPAGMSWAAFERLAKEDPKALVHVAYRDIYAKNTIYEMGEAKRLYNSLRKNHAAAKIRINRVRGNPPPDPVYHGAATEQPDGIHLKINPPHPFTHIAHQQRGPTRSAENTMLALQTLLPGVIHTAIEHGGDFLWRMTEPNAPYLKWGRDAVLNKAQRILRQIEGQKPGGWLLPFKRELEANIEDQSAYLKGKLSPAQIRQRLDRLLRLYIKQHAALPVYNRAQRLARDASVAIGTAMLKRRLELAEPALRRLIKAAQRKQTWVKEAGTMSKKNPEPHPLDPVYHGTVDRPERVPPRANDGDTIVVWRDEYNRWECWVYEGFSKTWSYAGQHPHKDPMITLAKDIAR